MMKQKTVMFVLCLASVLLVSQVSFVHTEPDWIIYDDDEVDTGVGGDVGWCFMVLFTPSFYPCEVVSATFYIYSPGSSSFEVHVTDTDRNDLSGFTPFTVTPASAGWLTVDLSEYNLTIGSGDFYISAELLNPPYVEFGCDLDEPTYYRSHYWYPSAPHMMIYEHNYMFRAEVVPVYESIYIRSDGSVEGTDKIQRDGDMYTFTDDIYGCIVVEKDDIVIDGGGHTLEGNGSGNGYEFYLMNNITIKNTCIAEFEKGIRISYSSSCSLINNTVIYNQMCGINAFGCSDNFIGNNSITNTVNPFHGVAILLQHSGGNTVVANIIQYHAWAGIELVDSGSAGNNLTGNTIEYTGAGINIWSAGGGNTAAENTIRYNGAGFSLVATEGTTVSGNDITDNGAGITFSSASNNFIYHNNFEGNSEQVPDNPSINIWDDDYPSGGNYWSDYADADLYGGPNQDEPGSDGIWDHPLVIDENNRDRYPLANPWTSHDNASLVVRGMDDRIYYRFYDTASHTWTEWTALPTGATPDSPASTICANALHIVVRGMDGNSIWYSNINLTDQTFTDWTQLTGATPSAPTLTSNDTTLILTVRGLDNLIYYRFCEIASQTWTDWTTLPSGATPDSPAATALDNQLHFVVRGMDGESLWHGSLDLSTDIFNGWLQLDGATESKPTLATCRSFNEICLVVRGLDNRIYHNSWNSSGWVGWTALPSGATPEGPGATAPEGTLKIVVVGMDGNSIWYSSINLNDQTFTDWTQLTGATPSTPTLTD